MDRSGSDLALVGLALVLVAVLVAYRRQIVSRLTHWKGRPRSSAPYAPLDQRPDVHLAVVGDTGARGRGLHQTAAVMASSTARTATTPCSSWTTTCTRRAYPDPR